VLAARRTPFATWCAVLIATGAAAYAIRANSFTPWGTDAAAYVEGAHRWAQGRLFEPSPLVLWLPEAGDGGPVTALGLRPGIERATDVVQYPPGLSLVMAAALLAVGDVGPYLVSPVCLAVLLWSLFVLGRRLAGPTCGLLAMSVMAMSPITVVSAVQPMSDVPAAALWMLAWALLYRPGAGAALAAGSVAGLAVLVRPNLAPLAVVLAGVALGVNGGPRTWQWRRGACMAIPVATGAALLLASQATLYGDALRSGYVGASAFFSTSYIPTNLTVYPRNLRSVHSGAIYLGLAAAPVLVAGLGGRRWGTAERRGVLWAALSILAMNVAVHAAYLPYDDLHYLRFFHLAHAVLCLLLALVVTEVARVITPRLGAFAPLAWLSVAPAVLVVATARPLIAYAASFPRQHGHVRVMGPYLEAVTTRQTVALAYIQSAAAAHATGMPVVRLDAIGSGALDTIVERLQAAGHDPVLLLDDVELAWFHERFRTSRYGALDWPPRARFVAETALQTFRPADRAAHLAGQRWPTDVVR
jgi:Dolichyl-phosphate-mannose-protein mannosyltransferase